MTISQRIFEELKNQKKKQKDLAEYIGLSTSAVSDWKKKGTNPAAENISAIADYLNLSIEYLLTGVEKKSYSAELSSDERELLQIFNKLSDKSKGKVLERAEMLSEIESAKTDREPVETRFIELSPMSVSAGTGEPLFDDSYPDFIQIKINDNTKDVSFAVKVNGNSMKPYYEDEDIVLVKSQPEVAIGQIGIFIIDNEGFIKKRGTDRLISLNPEYEDVYFKDEQEVWCKGLVVGILDEEDIIE